jgi:hypothetical protein
MTPLQGTDPKAIGPYRLLGRLGAGGMGQVYLGRSSDGVVVAIKVIRSDLADDPHFRARFRREVSAAQVARGPYTARVVAANSDGSPAWLATEYIPGPSLTEVVSGHGALPAAAATILTAGIAEALIALHRVGLVHRDLKPDNVLVLADGPRVIDFGVSRLADTSTVTHAGQLLGSPGFMAPEQVENADAVTPASDVFALGAVICYALTGIGPFGSGQTPTLTYRAVHEAPRIDGLPDPLRDLVARCLAKNPADRPTAEQVLAEILPAGTQVGELFSAGWLPDPVINDIRDRAQQLHQLEAPAAPHETIVRPHRPDGNRQSGAAPADARRFHLPAWSGFRLPAWSARRLRVFGVLGLLLALLAGSWVWWGPTATTAVKRELFGCPYAVELRVLASPADVGLVGHLADAYVDWAAARNGGCAAVRPYVFSASPDQVRAGLLSAWSQEYLRDVGPRPDVWLPESSLDVGQLAAATGQGGQPGLVTGQASIGWSPLVLAVPKDLVSGATGTYRQRTTWRDLLAVLDAGHRGYLRPSPGTSSAGALATLTLYESTAGARGQLPDVTSARRLEQRLEQALDQGGYPPGDADALLCRYRQLTDARTALIIPEQALLRLNLGLSLTAACGPPSGAAPPLVAFYPTDTATLDYPYARLRWSTGTDPQSQAAADFGAWLASDSGKAAVLSAGVRPPGPVGLKEPFSENNGVLPGAPIAAAWTPDVRTVDAALALRTRAGRHGRVLLAVDASGSMNEPAGGKSGTRFQVAAQGVQEAIQLLGDKDEYGLSVFHHDAADTLVPIGAGGTPVDGRPRRQATAGRLGGYTPSGGTPLFRAIIEGVADVANGDASRIRALVVLTDGEDTSGRNLNDVVAAIRDKHVRVFVLAVGQVRCAADAFVQVTTASAGSCQEADVSTVGERLTELFRTLWGGANGT